jgi:2'-5' RNA ligase
MRNKMPEKHIFVLAQYDLDTQRRLDDLYQVLINHGFIGTQTKGIPYHITLGTFHPEDEAEVVQRAQAAACVTKAFSLRLSYIGLFGLDVMFIAPAARHALLRLHHEILPSGGSADEHPWVAHTTLLMDKPDTIHRAIPVAAAHFTPFEAQVIKLGVYEFFPEREIGEYPLQA